MRVKDDMTRIQHLQLLHDKNRSLFAMIAYAEARVRIRWDESKELMMTSLFRMMNDPNHLHRNWLAADFRIHNAKRDGGEMGNIELTLPEMGLIVADLNQTFRYGRKWTGEITRVAHLRIFRDKDGRLTGDTHMHLQGHKRRFWK